MDPITLSLLGGAGSTLLSGIFGSKQAKAQQAEANRREKYNQMMSAMDTRYKAFGGGQGQKLQEMDGGGGAGAAWGRALGGGIQQGMNIYGALGQQNMNKEMLDLMRQNAGGGSASNYLDDYNFYKGLSSGMGSKAQF